MSGQSVELGNGGQKLESCDGDIAIRLKKKSYHEVLLVESKAKNVSEL